MNDNIAAYTIGSNEIKVVTNKKINLKEYIRGKIKQL